MITLRKLAELPPKTRARKILAVLGQEFEPAYQNGLVEMVREYLGDDPGSVPIGGQSPRDLGLLRHRLARKLGLEAADWDLQAPADREGEVVRFPFSVWLDDLRSPFNVGSIIRTAEAYGFEAVHHSLSTPGTEHSRTKRTAMGTEQHLLVRGQSLADLRSAWGTRPVFALELGGTPIDDFAFPAEGLVLVGGEELGLSPEALAWADASAGRVSLPLYGRKASLNVGVAFGILAAAWVRNQVALSPGDDSAAWV